jgi:hypothetical protein
VTRVADGIGIDDEPEWLGSSRGDDLDAAR